MGKKILGPQACRYCQVEKTYRMLRRKTDPKTGKHTLCEPAGSKCTWTFHKSHFVWKFRRKVPYTNPATPIFSEHGKPKRTWTFHKSPFAWTFTRKMPDPDHATHVLCEPAESKFTWTFHKSHFVWTFRREVKCRTPIPRHPFCGSLRSRSANGDFTRASLRGN